MTSEKSDPLDQVRQVIRSVIDRLDGEMAGDPIDAKHDVAPRVMRQIDREKITVPLVFVSAIEGIAQMARAELRRKHGTPAEREELGDEVDDSQLEFFATHLQPRYSITRNEWGKDEKGKRIYKYVPRDDITPAEFDKQVIRMLEQRRSAYDRHIDLARKWNEARKLQLAA